MQGRPQPINNLVNPVFGNGSGINWLTANRFFIKPRMVKIAISCHGQTSRDGGGCHDHHINITPFFTKQNALAYAKSMLFIDNCQSKIVKDGCVGQQGVCANNQ